MLEPGADGSKQSIASLVPERVVDLLESIEIEEDKRDRGLTSAGARHGQRKAVMEKRTIGKASDGVVLRNVRQAGFNPMSSDGGAQCGGDRLKKIGVVFTEAARIAPVSPQDSKRPIGCRDRDLEAAQQAVASHERREDRVSWGANVVNEDGVTRAQRGARRRPRSGTDGHGAYGARVPPHAGNQHQILLSV